MAAIASWHPPRLRTYDPQSGRFLTQDPIGLAGGINLFAYAGNNPIGFSDPFGLCPKDAGGDGKTESYSDCPRGSSGYSAQQAASGKGGAGNTIAGWYHSCKESTTCAATAIGGGIVTGGIILRGLYALATAAPAATAGSLTMTVHGAMRAAQSGRLNPEQIADVLDNATSTFTQSNGATAFVQAVGARYNVVIQNPQTQAIITNLKTISFNSLFKLAQKYGWQ